MLLGEDRYGYALPERAGDLPVVIDLGLEWSTFIGGTGFDHAWAIDHDLQPGAPFSQTRGSREHVCEVPLELAGNLLPPTHDPLGLRVEYRLDLDVLALAVSVTRLA